MSDEEQEREWEPVILGDGECHILDHPEFYETTKSIAAMVRDGALFVLRREDLKWVNVEQIALQQAADNVRPIRGR